MHVQDQQGHWPCWSSTGLPREVTLYTIRFPAVRLAAQECGAARLRREQAVAEGLRLWEGQAGDECDAGEREWADESVKGRRTAEELERAREESVSCAHRSRRRALEHDSINQRRWTLRARSAVDVAAVGQL